jgi:hypothetical protein
LLRSEAAFPERAEQDKGERERECVCVCVLQSALAFRAGEVRAGRNSEQRDERTSGAVADARVVGRSGKRHANRKRKGVRFSISWPSMRPDTGFYIGRIWK